MKEKKNNERYGLIFSVVIIVLSSMLLFLSKRDIYVIFILISLLSSTVILFGKLVKSMIEENKAYRILIIGEDDERGKSLVEKYHAALISREKGMTVLLWYGEDDTIRKIAPVFSAALSSGHRGKQELLRAYREALFTYEWHNGEKGVFLYEEEDGNISFDVKIKEMEREIERTPGNPLPLLDEYMSSLSIYPMPIQKALLVSSLMHLFPSLKEISLQKVLFSLSGDEIREELATLDDAREKEYAGDAEYTPRFREILDYIASNMNNEALSSSDVSDVFSISQSSLTREFQKNMGTTFSQYLHKLRLKAAKALLERDIAVKDVAVSVGYTNTLALTRAFHRYEGMTPGSYKRLN